MIDFDNTEDDELEGLALLYMLLNDAGYPMTEENEEDLREACAFLLMKKLMSLGVSFETAERKIIDDEGDFKLKWSRTEGLSIGKEFADAPEDGVSILIEVS